MRVDLHVHTPFSADYQDLNATYLQILQTAATRGLDMIALTDHNTVGGITAMRREIEDLTLLEELDRLTPEEAQILAEYRRLLNGMLVLPGIEFTAAYGFHVLGVFPRKRACGGSNICCLRSASPKRRWTRVALWSPIRRTCSRRTRSLTSLVASLSRRM